jgi:hypothetical protein
MASEMATGHADPFVLRDCNVKTIAGRVLDGVQASTHVAQLARQLGAPATRDRFLREYANAGSVFWGNIFDHDLFADASRVVVIEESGPGLGDAVVIETAMQQVREYLAKREPWQFSELIIWCADSGWCLFITHDDDCLIKRFSH